MGNASNKEIDWNSKYLDYKSKLSSKSSSDHNFDQQDFVIPKIVINDEEDSEFKENDMDWTPAAKFIQDYNYKLLKENYTNNQEFLIANLLFHSFRFFPEINIVPRDIQKFEENRKYELDKKLRDINQHVIISDAYVSVLNQYIGFRSEPDSELESLSSIKYNVVLNDIDARKVGTVYDNFPTNIDGDNDNLTRVLVYHGRKKNIGYCNIISTTIFKDRSDSVQTVQSEANSEDNLKIHVDLDTAANNIGFKKCFRQHRSHSIQDPDKIDDKLDGEWLLSPKKSRLAYKSESLRATVSSNAHETISFIENYGIIYSTQIIKGSFRKFESFTPVINVPYGLQKELQPWLRKEHTLSTKTGHTYEWPSQRDKDYTVTMNFNLTPFPRNKRDDLEWQIETTELFEVLFKTLSRNQIRAYLFGISIFKNFQTTLKPLNENHFKHILFDLVEKNPAGPVWFDENLGKTVYHIFQILQSYLKKSFFPHYLLPNWNLIGHFSSSVIHSIYSTVNKITEDYLGTILQVLPKLEYLSSNAHFPKINMQHIESILKGTQPYDKHSFTQFLYELMIHFLKMATASYRLKDSDLYFSYIFSIENLIRLTEEQDLDINMPELNSIIVNLETLKLKSRRTSHYHFWHHNLSSDNSLLAH
ncbi:uncharacterized protein [Lepeophtheirus salmonis]|nr:uncharacterized protein LOC121121353 [Lepeophtheirus salmonis]